MNKTIKNYVGSFYSISMSMYPKGIAFIGIINFIFFFGSSHSFNLGDPEQMKFFVSNILLIITSLVLLKFDFTMAQEIRQSLYHMVVISLFGSLASLTYAISELSRAKYGDDKTYFIFLVLVVSSVMNLFLLYFFIFKKRLTIPTYTSS